MLRIIEEINEWVNDESIPIFGMLNKNKYSKYKTASESLKDWI